jgi:hypothetical protein
VTGRRAGCLAALALLGSTQAAAQEPRAALEGPTGCVRRPFEAVVRGTGIARVEFHLDGRREKTLRRANHARAFALRVDPARLRLGVHRVLAKVTFAPAAGARARTYRLSFQRCPRALRAPRFTG